MEVPVKVSDPIKDTAKKMKFSIKDFFGKCDQMRSFLRICSHLLEKSLIEKLIFCIVGRFVVSQCNVP